MPTRPYRREWTIRKWFCAGNLKECADGRMYRFEYFWERTRWEGQQRHGATHDTRGEGWVGRRRYLPGDPRYGFWGDAGDILRPYARVDGHTGIIYAWGRHRPRFILNPRADLGAHCYIDCPRFEPSARKAG